MSKYLSLLNSSDAKEHHGYIVLDISIQKQVLGALSIRTSTQICTFVSLYAYIHEQ